MKLKYYMRGVGTGILFTMFIFIVIIIPNLKLENKIAGTAEQVNENSDISGLVGRDGAGDLTDVPAEEPAGQPDELLTPTPEQKPTEEPTKAPDEEPTKEPTAVPTEEPTKEPTKEPAKEPTKEPTKAPTQVPTQEVKPTKAPTPTPKVVVDEDTGKVTFTITNGMTSETFSKGMEDNGIVDDWKALNNYISKNGYAKKMQVGTFTFTPGMSYYEICKKIMGKNMK